MTGARLLRSLGLLADGPVRWGKPPSSRRPGVYLVELPEPKPRIPVDLVVLRRWIERVPTLRIDGSQPTPQELADRLGAFWLPDQSVLYVGRTTASLAGRLRASYRTPLGDPRPHAGGHWLKTLSGLDGLLVWWAETDAPIEFEDALLDAFAAGVEETSAGGLRDPDVVLPFANLQTALGVRKRHGISGSLLPEAAEVPSDSAASGPRRPRPGAPSRSVPVRSTGRARKAPDVRPAPAATRLSAAGLEQLQVELAERSGVRRLEIAGRIKAARELGDLRENADYEAARREQSFNEGRVQSIEALLRHAVVLDDADETSGMPVRVGSTVVIESDGGKPTTYIIVGPAEADPANGRISDRSPIGAALIGRRAGDEVAVVTPSGRTSLRVAEVR